MVNKDVIKVIGRKFLVLGLITALGIGGWMTYSDREEHSGNKSTRKQEEQENDKKLKIGDKLPMNKFKSLRPLYYQSSIFTGDEIYTTDFKEINESWFFDFKGVSGCILSEMKPGTLPLYRVFNYGKGPHFYTTNLSEREEYLKKGWKDEGITGYLYAEQQPGTLPFYRLHNPTKINNESIDLYTYTANAEDRKKALNSSYIDEGIVGYVLPGIFYEDVKRAEGKNEIEF